MDNTNPSDGAGVGGQDEHCFGEHAHSTDHQSAPAIREPSSRLPYYPWYASDFSGATRGYSLTAKGLLRELLDAQWDMGGLPNCAEQLKAISGATPNEWKKAWATVRIKFPACPDGMLRNPRMEMLRATAIVGAATNRANGKAGGLKRAQNLRQQEAQR